MSGQFKHLEHFRFLEQKEWFEVSSRNHCVLGLDI